MGKAPRAAPRRPRPRDPGGDEHLPAAVVARLELLPLPGEPVVAAALRGAQLLREGHLGPQRLGPAPDDRHRGRADGRAPAHHRLRSRPHVRARVPGPAHPAHAGADPDDAELRRGRGLLPLLLRADVRPVEPSGTGLYRRALHPARISGGGDRRHCLRRRMDVVTLRDAARARGARQRAEVPLRGSRDRFARRGGGASAPSPCRTSGGSSSSPSSSGPSRRSSSST